MKFGPLDSPTKTIDLLNLVDHLRVVLAAIPFVSQAEAKCMTTAVRGWRAILSLK